ncbi:MAG TPA: serine hydrolase [Longimicrobiales bacterium]|nr:serine hydrolase [Longimicrobiales bacterium]
MPPVPSATAPIRLPRAPRAPFHLPAALAAVLAAAAPAAAQHFPADPNLLALVRERVEQGRAKGIVLGVLEADGSTRIVSWGDPGHGAQPLGERSVFEIGSITKVFTGTLLAEMAERGEVRLEEPVQDLLPPGVTVPSRSGKAIRVVDLSTQVSGLPRLPGNLRPADATNPYADYRAENLYAALGGLTLDRDPGERYEYSNLGVGLLGHALALRAGVSYEDLVRRRILEPLGMSHTGTTLTPEMQAWMVKGHDQAGNAVGIWDFDALAGAGALRSDMHDMLAFLKGNVGEPRSPLERAMRTAHAVRAPAGPNMEIGLNWHVRAVGEDRIVWHNGGTGGFRTFIGFDPARRVGVVVLTNSAHGADDIGFHLVNPAVPLQPPPAPPRQRSEVAVVRDILQRYVGVYELTPQFRIEITLDGAGLGLQATGQPRLPLFAESETAFFLKVVDAQVQFVVEAGVVTALVLHQGGAAQTARRLPPPSL